MQFELQPHPSTPTKLRVSVDVGRNDCGLDLAYTLSGALARVVIPPAAPQVRTDELWRTTCFELFVKGEGAQYHEFNFSPSGAWAAYEFDGYRSGMQAIGLPDLPETDTEIESDNIRLKGALIFGKMMEELKIGLSAIVELLDGSRLYFALAHPPGKPDFHHEACFAATLPPMSAA